MQTFTYDALSRLVGASTSAFGSGQYNESYSYNAATGNLAVKASYSHTYADPDHPHAVTQASNGLVTNTYVYDANGNMTTRTLGSTSYTLTYDHESRLTNVVGGSTDDSYTYDGDGARILVVSGNTTTVYIGDYYEYTLTPSTGSGGEEGGEGPPPAPTVSTRAYYYAGSQRIAMRNPASATGSTGLTMLYGDHLGSASVAVDGSNNVTRMRYKAWGEARGTSASAFVTDRLFTGQVYDGDVSAGGTGLYYYNARMYDPALGRFTQADTIVPEPSRPLAFDRYAYVYNNPVRYSDPSGHCIFAGVDTIACLLVALKILDYGWTAWDMWQAGRTIASPNASRGEKVLAAVTISMAALFEAVEPDDLLPIGLPLDDAARKILTRQANNAFAEGGEYGLRRWLSNRFGHYGDEVLNKMDNLIGTVCSFSADTDVTTSMGLVPIGKIKEGDVVLAYNEATGEVGYYPVSAVWSHDDPETVYLTVDGEVVETTPEHPFYTDDGLWMPVSELSVGQKLWQADGSLGVVEAINVVAELQPMYNLTVSVAHTYFVGDGQLLVHNDCVRNYRYRPFTDSANLDRGLVEQMYRGYWENGQWFSLDQYVGGLAGAVRRELATGKPVGGKSHYAKATDRLRQMADILASGMYNGTALSQRDLDIVRGLYRDLQNAMHGN